MQNTNLLAKLALLAAASCAAANATVIFNFENDTIGTLTDFTDTVGNLSATFTSPANPGAYSIQPSFFSTLTGNVLISGTTTPLTIDFSSNLSAIDLVFATANFFTPSPFNLTAFEGNTQVGVNTLSAMFIGSFQFPEGEIAFDGVNFNKVVLSSPVSFAIDNVLTAPGTATPEPNIGWLLGIALIAVGATKRSK